MGQYRIAISAAAAANAADLSKQLLLVSSRAGAGAVWQWAYFFQFGPTKVLLAGLDPGGHRDRPILSHCRPSSDLSKSRILLKKYSKSRILSI